MGTFSRISSRKKKKKNHTRTPSNQSNPSADTSGEAKEISRKKLAGNLEEDLQYLISETGQSSDIIIRELAIGPEHGTKAAVIVTDGLINNQTVNNSILKMMLDPFSFPDSPDPETIFQKLKTGILSVSGVKEILYWDDLFFSLLTGETIILMDGNPVALATNTKGGEVRQIGEPKAEISIRGAQDSFTESIRINTSLVRRRIVNPHLHLESMTLGKVTQTKVEIMYIKGIANDKIVQEVRDRLQRIDIDQMIDAGYIEQMIEDETFTTFPTVFYTERPDIVASNLLEGKVAIFVQGSPSVITVPALFVEFFQSADDYYMRFDISTALRILRVLIFILSILAPAAYVAVTTFHQEMIPTTLIIAIAAQREAIPFPAFVEALVMEITFEILREAGVRLPRAIGQAVSIVGALVIGQAAIQASIVSPAMVIIVAITAIANFAIPSYSVAISTRLIRFVLMALSAFMGFYGIIFGLTIMIFHLCSLRSFGIPYLAPLAPLMARNIGDSIIRLPLWAMRSRPTLISQKNIIRVGNEQRPFPDQSGENR